MRHEASEIATIQGLAFSAASVGFSHKLFLYGIFIGLIFSILSNYIIGMLKDLDIIFRIFLLLIAIFISGLILFDIYSKGTQISEKASELQNISHKRLLDFKEKYGIAPHQINFSKKQS